jgi:hypothetical protein
MPMPRVLIALGAVVRISGRERDGHAGRRPAGHSDGHKKNQKILHRPQPRRPPPTQRPPKAPDPRPCQGQIMAQSAKTRSEPRHTAFAYLTASNSYWPID